MRLGELTIRQPHLPARSASLRLAWDRMRTISEGFSILRMPAMLLERRTLQVRISRFSFAASDCALFRIQGLKSLSRPTKLSAGVRYRRIGATSTSLDTILY